MIFFFVDAKTRKRKKCKNKCKNKMDAVENWVCNASSPCAIKSNDLFIYLLLLWIATRFNLSPFSFNILIFNCRCRLPHIYYIYLHMVSVSRLIHIYKYNWLIKLLAVWFPCWLTERSLFFFSRFINKRFQFISTFIRFTWRLIRVFTVCDSSSWIRHTTCMRRWISSKFHFNGLFQ